MKALITGGTRGIGREIALAFARAGATVIVGARNVEQFEEFNRELITANPGATHRCLGVDCSREEELRVFFEDVEDSYGTIDVLVNNVGMYREAGLLDEPEGLLEEMLRLNLLSAYHCSRFFAKGMKEQERGHIFNVCSVASLKAVAVAGAYTVSKHALLGLSRTLREELRPFGVKVTSVIPGSVATSSWDGSDPGVRRHLIDPADVASAVMNTYGMGPTANVDELHITPTKPISAG